MKSSDLLKMVEGKQVGVVYHFTNTKGIDGMFSSDFVMRGTVKDPKTGKNFISFTRHYALPDVVKSDDLGASFEGAEVRIALDGDSMSNRYKFEPYSDIVDKEQIRKSSRKFEYEERIVKPKVDIKPYVLSIDIKGNKKFFEDLKKDMEKEFPKLAEKMNLVQRWRPVKR